MQSIRIRFILALSLLFSNFVCSFSYAEELPLWELSLGLGGLNQSYYTGTKQTRNYLFPIILPVYRGELLKSDDKGIRAELFNDERYKLDLSLDFNFSVDSEDIDLRQGMPDIDSQLQIGPSLEIMLSKSAQHEFQFNLPFRATFSISGDGIDQKGYTFSPNFSYVHQLSQGNKPWRLGLSVGPQFGDRDYHDIYYGVADEFVTANRAAYDTESGYSGSRLQLALTSKNRKRLWVWFLRYENISGASFEDSPLVETNDNLTVGFLYSRYLFQSKTMVNR